MNSQLTDATSHIRAVVSTGMKSDVRPREGLRGILADDGRIRVWLHLALVLLTVAAVWRYLNGHGLGDRAPVILGLAGLLLAVYSGATLVARTGSPVVTAGWCLSVVAVWFALVLLAPSFSWVAVPLAFVTLRVLRFAAAVSVVAAMVAAVIAAWTNMVGELDPTIIVGPVSIAGLAVFAYRLLERESAERQRLLDQLREAQDDVADAQHNAGVLAERARLSRDIHDSVAQGLTSINLLLTAAEEQRTAAPASAHEYVNQAARTARDSLDEVRRVVRDLAPSALSDGTGVSLEDALTQACADVAQNSELKISVCVHGDPTPIRSDISTALLRSARGALANVVEHAGATEATLSLTYQADLVSLDVRDNGIGFDPQAVSRTNARGRGLTGIRSRVEHFGGHIAVESTPGEGTALAVSIPTNLPQ